MTYDVRLRAGDLDLDAIGQAALIGGADQIAQQIRLTLLTFRDEWFLDSAFGLPWFEEIAGKGRTNEGIAAAVRIAVADVPGVTQVGPVTVTRDHTTRAVTITLPSVVTSEGRLPQIVQIIPG